MLSCCQYAIMTQTRNSNKERPPITLSLSLSHLYENSILHYVSDITTFLVYEKSAALSAFPSDPKYQQR